ncbi:4018_t:CDS:2 [Rhizophagus irregularis]|nr:4018_t:CDS:2 [Rhizophagus irregularis]
MIVPPNVIVILLISKYNNKVNIKKQRCLGISVDDLNLLVPKGHPLPHLFFGFYKIGTEGSIFSLLLVSSS